MNAGLAREAAELAVTRYVKRAGGQMEGMAPGNPLNENDTKDEALKGLEMEVMKARARESAKRSAWEREKDAMSRHVRNLGNSW